MLEAKRLALRERFLGDIGLSRLLTRVSRHDQEQDTTAEQ